MIHDATVEVTCDKDGCNETCLLKPKYVHSDRSEGGGHYDTSDGSLYKLLEVQGWSIEGDKTFCEAHERK